MPKPINKVERSCQTCGASFVVWPRDVKRGTDKFCSRACFHERLKVPLNVRFRRHVGEEDANGCLPWTGKRDKHGYGRIFRGDGDSREVFAHRVAYELAHGPIPDGGQVLHRCDSPPCVAISHLFLGDHVSNMADKQVKGRQARGEGNASAKTVADVVREIRSRYKAGGITLKQLAAQYDLSTSGVCYIVNRTRWKHVD